MKSIGIHKLIGRLDRAYHDDRTLVLNDLNDKSAGDGLAAFIVNDIKSIVEPKKKLNHADLISVERDLECAIDELTRVKAEVIAISGEVS